MEKNTWQKYSIIYTVISIIVITVLSIFLFRSCNAPKEPIIIDVHDTLLITKHDTCWKDTVIYRTKWDTLLVIEKDSIKDTIKLELPIEHKQASFKTSKDSIDIEAKIQYHGFQAEIDTVQIGYNFHWTEEVKKKKKIQLTWSIGPTVGYGFGLNGNTIVGTPYLGIGATIGFGNVIETK